MTTELHHTISEPPATSAGLLTPEEPLLHRYSPHHEFSISTVFSVVAHLVVGLLAFLFGAFVIDWGIDRTLPSFDHIVILDPDAGGGGPGRRGGEPDAPPPPDVYRPGAEDPQVSSARSDKPFTLDDPPTAVDVKALIAAERAKGTVPGALAKDEGRGGNGSGGGKGNGNGPGEGDGTRAGRQKKVDDREKRMERWIVAIPYDNGLDYLNKLANLQAALAVPEGKDSYRVYDDLSVRPFESLVQSAADAGRLNRLYWTLTDPQVLGELGQALHLRGTPVVAYVFLPRPLEVEMLRKELLHANLTEQQLNERKIETKFKADRRGKEWVVTVLEQRPRKSGR